MRFNKVLLVQTSEKDCGKAALRMLLAYVHNSENYLTLSLEGGSDNFLSIKNLAERNGGVILSGKKVFALSDFKGIEGPFIAQSNEGGVNHFVLCLIKGKKLLINDPSGEYYAIKLKELNKLIFTNILIVDSVTKKDPPKAVKIRYRMQAFIYEILFVLLLGFGFLFMGNEDLSLLSYISFTLAALSKIIEQQFVLKSLGRFDKCYVTPLIAGEKEMSKVQFQSIQTAKQVVFGFPLQLFTRFLNVLLITIILAYNNYYLLVICLFSIIGALFLTKGTLTKTRTEWELKAREVKLFSKNKEIRSEIYQVVINETNKLAKKQIYYTVIALFALAATIFLLMFMTETFSLNYFLFYFFTFAFYFNELKKIFTLIEDKSTYYRGINVIFNWKN